MPVYYEFYTPAGQFTFTGLAVASQRHAVVWSCRAVALPLCEAAVARCCRYNNGNNGNNGISVANNGTSLLPSAIAATAQSSYAVNSGIFKILTTRRRFAVMSWTHTQIELKLVTVLEIILLP